MKALGAILLASLAGAGCGAKCKESPDVLLEFAGDDALLAQVGSVELSVVVNGGQAEQLPLVMTGPLTSGATVLLSATSVPDTATYSLVVDAALRSQSGVEIALGTVVATVGSHACNRLELPVVPDAQDMSVAEDVATAGELGPDLACVPNGYDEDGDGLSDPCDVCAATPDPGDVDTDGDGVPNACDPSPTEINHVTLFEPFNETPAWNGPFATSTSDGQLVLDGGDDCMHYAYDPAGIGVSAQLQTYVTPTSIVGGVKGISYAGLALLDAIEPTRGMSCTLQRNPSNTELVLSQGAIFLDPNTSETLPTSSPALINTARYTAGEQQRLVLTLSEGMVACSLFSVPTATTSSVLVKTLTASAQFTPSDTVAALTTCYASATFSYVFGVSAP